MPHARRLLRPCQHERLVHDRQALADEAVHLPDAGALAAAAQAAAAGATAGTGSTRATARHNAHFGKAVGVEQHGELELRHAIRPTAGHLLQHRVRHGDGLRGSPGLCQELVGRLRAEVALHQEHGLLHTIFPLRVDLRARHELVHRTLELALRVAGHTLIPCVPRHVHAEDVGTADGQAVAIVQGPPVLAHQAAIHSHEAAAQGPGSQVRVVLVCHSTDLGTDTEASEPHLAALLVRANGRLADGQVVDQAALQGRVWVQVDKPRRIGHVL
mmetsp:Transcript_18466/g.50841  ORF Transcript_18466/g.50841 Transcript_18466/m.50841 type:complete len:272 (+) Transcript_18466:773-1588(+)